MTGLRKDRGRYRRVSKMGGGADMGLVRRRDKDGDRGGGGIDRLASGRKGAVRTTFRGGESNLNPGTGGTDEARGRGGRL